MSSPKCVRNVGLPPHLRPRRAPVVFQTGDSVRNRAAKTSGVVKYSFVQIWYWVTRFDPKTNRPTIVRKFKRSRRQNLVPCHPKPASLRIGTLVDVVGMRKIYQVCAIQKQISVLVTLDQTDRDSWIDGTYLELF